MNQFKFAVKQRPMMRAPLLLGLSAFLTAPAHAFISFSFTELALVLLLLVWPWLLPVFALWLVKLWKHRRAKPKRLIATVLVFLFGTTLWLSHSIPDWQRSLSLARSERAWDAVDEAAAARQYEKAWKLITEHPNGDVYDYLQRQIERPDSVPDLPFARAIFERCVGLTDPAPYKDANALLKQAINLGRYEIVEAWVTTPPCQTPNARDRERDLFEYRDALVPHLPDKYEPAYRALRQAKSVQILVKHYPSLLSPLPADSCWMNRRQGDPCSLLMLAFLGRHHEAVRALVEIDDKMDEHLPPLLAHMLRNDATRVHAAALADPSAVMHWLPEMFASAPLQSLQTALKATPINEHTLVMGDSNNTQFHLLRPVFEEAERRDLNQPTWVFLDLLLDQFPTQLSKLDTLLLEHYGPTTPYEQPQGLAMLKRLRASGMECSSMQNFIDWGSTQREEGVAAMAVFGCKPPDDWRPYEPPKMK